MLFDYLIENNGEVKTAFEKELNEQDKEFIKRLISKDKASVDVVKYQNRFRHSFQFERLS